MSDGEEEQWAVIDHVCRHCMCRLLRRVSKNGISVMRCSSCEETVVGEHDSLCWCGVEVKGHGAVFECIRNPAITPFCRHTILVREKPLLRAPEKKLPKNVKPVRTHGYVD